MYVNTSIRVDITGREREKERERKKKSMNGTHLDDAADEFDHVGKLLKIDVEVVQLVLQSLLGHDLAPLAHGTQTPEIARGIERRIRGLGKVDLGHMRRHWGQRALETAETRGRGATVGAEVERVGAHALVIAVRAEAVAVGVVRVKAGRVFGDWPGCFGFPAEQTHLFLSLFLIFFRVLMLD